MYLKDCCEAKSYSTPKSRNELNGSVVGRQKSKPKLIIRTEKVF